MNRDQQNKFDEQIRQELDSLQPDYLPQSWDKLSDRLSETPDPAQAADDERVRDALNSVTPVYETSSWEALSNKIDKRNNAGADEIIIDRLDRLAAPTYRAGSWALLAARLELISQRRSCLTALKITEFSLLLSALLLFWNFFPYGGFNSETSETIIAENAFPLPLLPTTGTANVVNPTTDFSITPNPLSVERGYSSQESSAIVANTSRVNLSATTSSNSERVLASLPTISSFVSLPVGELAPGINLENEIASIEGIEFTPYLPKTIPQPALNLLRNNKKEGIHSLRIFVSPWDFNRVVTPAFSVSDKEIERDVRLSHGFSAGVLFDHDHDKNGHSYGVIYGRRSYVPTVFANVEGNAQTTVPSPLQPRDTNYSRIIFHTVSLPFNYQRALYDNGRWRLTATAGLEANVVLSSKFYKSPNFDENINNYLRNSSPIGVARSAKNPLSKEDLTNPEEGLLQGGSALRNSSLYFTAGFSLERKLSEFSSVFIAPQFSRALYYRRDTGLGPFDDRIHPNSIRFGARYRLGQ